MEVRIVETPVHGRVLFERRDPARLIVGFHGYAETADVHLAALSAVPGSDQWSVAAVQALHPFYVTKTGAVVASWMTSLDRELAIRDNIEYVRRVLASLPSARTIVFTGFSQGVAMAFRAAAFTGVNAAGVIALAADVPPDVVAAKPPLPPVLMGRGLRDEWYSQEKWDRDVAFLSSVTSLRQCLFEGGHEWTDPFRAAAGDFLRSVAG